MSILFFEGFETVGTELGLANEATTRPRINLRWDATGSGGAPATDSFFLIDDFVSEGFAIQMGSNSFSNGNLLQWDVPSAKQQGPGASFDPWVIGARVHIPSATRTDEFFKIDGIFGSSSPTGVLAIRFVDSTDIQIFRDSPSSFVIDTVLDVLSPGTWHYIECRFKIAESGDGGFVQVWVDDVLVSDNQSVDTNNALTFGFTNIKFTTTNATTSADDFVGFDDIYVVWEGETPSTGRLGATRVRSLPPNVQGSGGWDRETVLSLATTLDGAAETIIDVGTGNIPAGTPATGTIEVELDVGGRFSIAYTSHDGDDEFTTASTDWTDPDDASSGNDVFLSFTPNFIHINENGANPNTYVETDIDAVRDRYGITATTSDKAVWSVKLEAEARNETGGTPDLIIELASGSTVAATPVTVSDTSNYNVFDVYHQLDPDTNDAWINSNVDAIETGFVFDNKVS